MHKRISSLLFAAGTTFIAFGLLVAAAFTPQDCASAQEATPQQPDQACIDCHSDEARLRELATEDVVVEPVSEGPG